MDVLDQYAIRRIRRTLKNWYDRHHRELPWRNVRRRLPGAGAGAGTTRPDPYHVLVSEAMLQQTQVTTVIEYFDRFIERLPTVRSLAKADPQHVLRLWQGLGYYRRALNLHAAGKMIVRDFGGHLPSQVELLVKLPGVGRYTAGAIASIAFDRPTPVLDGNVARVLARWLAIQDPIDAPRTRDTLWKVAGTLVPRTRPGDFNQALMELGALICTPRRPGCLTCPVAAYCRANATAQADRLPIRLARKAPKRVAHHIVAVQKNGKTLFEQRPAKGLWSSMWQMPTAEHLGARVEPRQLQSWIAAHLGLGVTRPRQTGVFDHRTTHRLIRFVFWQATARPGRLRRGAGIWRRLDAIDDMPLANPQRRVVRELKRRVNQQPPA